MNRQQIDFDQQMNLKAKRCVCWGFHSGLFMPDSFCGKLYNFTVVKFYVKVNALDIFVSFGKNNKYELRKYLKIRYLKKQKKTHKQNLNFWLLLEDFCFFEISTRGW